MDSCFVLNVPFSCSLLIISTWNLRYEENVDSCPDFLSRTSVQPILLLNEGWLPVLLSLLVAVILTWDASHISFVDMWTVIVNSLEIKSCSCCCQKCPFFWKEKLDSVVGELQGLKSCWNIFLSNFVADIAAGPTQPNLLEEYFDSGLFSVRLLWSKAITRVKTSWICYHCGSLDHRVNNFRLCPISWITLSHWRLR